MTLEISFEDLLRSNRNLGIIFKRNKLKLIKNIILNKYGTLKNFSKQINCNLPTLSSVLNARFNPRAHLAKSIVNKLNLEIKRCVLKIVSDSKPNSSFIRPENLPIIANANLARLIGHCFGDGHLKKVFSYTNKNKTLLNNVIKCVNKLPIKNLSSNEHYHGAKTIRFSTLVRDILIAAEAPTGNKITNLYYLPL